MIRNDFVAIYLDVNGKQILLATMSNAEFKAKKLVKAINRTAAIVCYELQNAMHNNIHNTKTLPNSISLILMVDRGLYPFERKIDVNAISLNNIDSTIRQNADSISKEMRETLTFIITCTPEFIIQNSKKAKTKSV